MPQPIVTPDVVLIHAYPAAFIPDQDNVVATYTSDGPLLTFDNAGGDVSYIFTLADGATNFRLVSAVENVAPFTKFLGTTPHCFFRDPDTLAIENYTGVKDPLPGSWIMVFEETINAPMTDATGPFFINVPVKIRYFKPGPGLPTITPNPITLYAYPIISPEAVTVGTFDSLNTQLIFADSLDTAASVTFSDGSIINLSFQNIPAGIPVKQLVLEAVGYNDPLTGLAFDWEGYITQQAGTWEIRGTQTTTVLAKDNIDNSTVPLTVTIIFHFPAVPPVVQEYNSWGVAEASIDSWSLSDTPPEPPPIP